MHALAKDPPGVAGPRRVRRRAAVALPGILLALAVLWAAAACGDETPGTTAGAVTSASPSADVEGPPKFPGGFCERTTADRKSLPSAARTTIERFIAAADRGDAAVMRVLLDPAIANEVLAGLRPVSRLGLLELQDRY